MFSYVALILVVLKVLGLTALSWGWCLAGFGLDAAIALLAIGLGFKLAYFSKRV